MGLAIMENRNGALCRTRRPAPFLAQCTGASISSAGPWLYRQSCKRSHSVGQADVGMTSLAPTGFCIYSEGGRAAGTAACLVGSPSGDMEEVVAVVNEKKYTKYGQQDRDHFFPSASDNIAILTQP
jgi:hypothetical protein